MIDAVKARGVAPRDLLVTLVGHKARVEYDDAQCTVNDLLAAVAGIRDPAVPMAFSATVKQ